MSVKIRLTRLGDKHNALYRIVVADSRMPRDGGVIDNIGTYNPNTNPAQIKVDLEKATRWISNGAQPTDTAKDILKKAGYDFSKKIVKAEKTVVKKATKSTKPVAKVAKVAKVEKPAVKTEAPAKKATPAKKASK